MRELHERPIAGPGVGLGWRDRLVGQDVGVLGAARRTGADLGAELGHHELVGHGLARAGQSEGSELGSDLLASHGVAAAEQLLEQGGTALEDLSGEAELAVTSRHGALRPWAGERLDPAQVFGCDEVPRRPQDVGAHPTAGRLLSQHGGIPFSARPHRQRVGREGCVLALDAGEESDGISGTRERCRRESLHREASTNRPSQRSRCASCAASCRTAAPCPVYGDVCETCPVSEQPGRYQRSVSGMVGAMVVLLLVMAAYVGFRALNRDELEVEPETVDYLEAVQFAQDADWTVVYPPAVPEGWRSTSVESQQGEAWGIGFLTPDGFARPAPVRRARRRSCWRPTSPRRPPSSTRSRSTGRRLGVGGVRGRRRRPRLPGRGRRRAGARLRVGTGRPTLQQLAGSLTTEPLS